MLIPRLNAWGRTLPLACRRRSSAEPAASTTLIPRPAPAVTEPRAAA